MAPLPALQLTEWNIKRILGYVSWHSKRKTMHCAHVLDALKHDLKRQAPDHICVTGDLVNLGLEQEYKNSALLLRSLGPAKNISIIPGNHEAYGRHYNDYIKRYWSPWLKDDMNIAADTFPYVHIRGDHAFIGISSAIPTWPFMANGYVSEEQCNALGEILVELEAQNKTRVIMIHHPPISGLIQPRKSLSKPYAFLDMVREFGAELILHGHAHKDFDYTIEGMDKPIRVLGVGSASYDNEDMQKKGHYHMITLDGHGTNVQLSIEHRHYNIAKDMFEEGKQA
jgi:3',5'-cyclic AMP phosphodiesterase CpdA